jgi:hypothetical protein
MRLAVGIIVLLIVAPVLLASGLQADTSRSAYVIDDFEADTPGRWPNKWKFLSSKQRRFEPLGQFMSEKERFFIVEEGGNKFVRAYTEGEAQRISIPAMSIDWNLTEYPRLAWRWRARKLPQGAGEDKVNDAGGAVYVSFAKTDWLGRPYSIKYTYSSSLPAGTVVSTGNVKNIVVSTRTGGTGRWIEVERDVVEDYQRVFGSEPPAEPFTITLWSDSDDTKSVAEVDFDDITLLKK